MAKPKKANNLARLAALGGPGGRASKAELAQLRALAISGSAPWGQSSGKSLAGGMADRAGDLGLNALKALSVPSAALGTVLAKGAGLDYSWKNALGDFKPGGGYKGWEGILDAAGSDNKGLNKWLGMGLDIAVDPLWLVAPTKVLRTASKVSTGASALKALGKIEDATKITVRQNHTVQAASEALHPRGRFVRRIRDAKYKPFSGKVRGTVIGRETAEGSPVGEHMFAFRLGASNKKGAADRFGLAVLTNPDEWTGGARVLDETFSSVDDAVRHAKKLLAQGERLIKTDRGGLPAADTFEKSLAGITKAQTEALTGERNLGFKLGVGKVNPEGGRGLSGLNYTFRTGTKLPTKSLQTHKLGRMFRRDPVEKIAHRNIQAFNDFRQATPAMQAALRQSFNLTDEEAQLVGTIAAADNASFNGVEGMKLLGTDVLKPILQQEGKWTDDMERALMYGRDRWEQFRKAEGIGLDTARGPYAPAGPAEEGLQRLLAHYRNTEKVPEDANHLFRQRMAQFGVSDATQGRSFQTAFAYRTADEWKAAFEQMGLDPELADLFVQRIGQHLDEVGPALAKASKQGVEKAKVGFAEESLTQLEDVTDRIMLSYGPELNIFNMITRREVAHARGMLNRQIEELAQAAQITDNPQLMAQLTKQANAEGIPGSFAATPVGVFLRKWVPQYKSMLTTLNQAHFPNNAFGDFFNALVTGNITHANPMNLLKVNFGVAGKDGVRAAKGATFWKLAAGDDQVLKQTFQIGAHEYTGYEVYMLSHMMGLGKGYVGADIGDFIRLYEGSRNPLKTFRDFMQRQNMTREDSQRLHTWFLHLRSGDDPFTAMGKTLRVHFDYNDLTDFERVILRNTLMFYTWFKKNLVLQATGLVTKPGLYSAYGDIERGRPKFENEPGYMSKQGAIPIPGYGNLVAGAPWADLFKADFSNGPGEVVKQDILASLAPQFKIPLELTHGQEYFTKRRIPSDPQSAEDWQKLGKYFLGQAGPVPGTITKLADPGTSERNIIDDLAQIFGVGRRQVDDPEKYARMARFYGGS